MSSFVERAPTNRTKCQVCGNAIAYDELRTVDETTYVFEGEERSKRTYCHLPCAVEIRRQHAYDALIGVATSEEMYAAAIALVTDAKLVEETRPHRRVAIERRAMALADPLTGDLLAELEASPNDRALLTVLADQLQERGDERGELIMLDLAPGMGELPKDLTAINRRRELTTAMTPKLGPTDLGHWGAGFYRKLTLRFTSPEQLAALLAHPTSRLLQSLEIMQANTIRLSSDMLPRSLRALHVHGELAAESDLASLPYLRELRLVGFTTLAHPTLPFLEIESGTHARLGALDPDRLPKLAHLSLKRHRDDGAVTELARLGWFARLTTLELAYMVFEPDEIEHLERALDGRRLERLTVIGTRITDAERPRLDALCDRFDLRISESVATPTTGPVYVEHTNKPEWGRGTLVREYDDKIEVAFESGNRTFKADAPFLKRTR